MSTAPDSAPKTPSSIDTDPTPMSPLSAFRVPMLSLNPALSSPPSFSLSRTRSLPISPSSEPRTPLPSPGLQASLTDLDLPERLTHTQRVARATREFRDAWIVME
ncbi:hypothetical protein BWQ96_01216 [Gracilariopsis chorda]|uniref:Uncharacterized protein n=1 Tax=Gracilariopsis chorda TaxID=448386 RepID=A0A2V3J3U1_9FLOR|nr:hypothetical protein BWQ96_01216 [Gracilariopsis chorda]|eukprot:PXF49078.1 hypothetical protein BWQ96_01216 [Gracilariopsis chorda]